ncbi:hypothetical protein NDU88_003760 [Pleurodeles waltl]|uniref:Uncharacterized protein n=1 Tax=Pleurodeles waltl TaxID=8319 RepID=A0AAV7PFI8_PLEWA|nr:hypothetical protein NDU88_003760 [Pleurodeles waltl]
MENCKGPEKGNIMQESKVQARRQEQQNGVWALIVETLKWEATEQDDTQASAGGGAPTCSPGAPQRGAQGKIQKTSRVGRKEKKAESEEKHGQQPPEQEEKHWRQTPERESRSRRRVPAR